MFERGLYLVIFSLFCLEQESSAYNVALVEYLYDDQVFPYLSSLDLANRNSEIYNDIVATIKRDHGKLDIVVYPEATLVAEPLDTPAGRLGMTFVPKVEDNIIPCNSSKKEFSGFFKLLSCTAQKYRTYLVINLKEKDDTGGKMQFYNTNVVFDRDGRVIARYRKYNLYLEPDTSRPNEPQLVSFKTDFGETFGLFTCFDILFKKPSIDMVRKGVNNFIFPTLWIPELPFLTTNQVQQMWAQGNDVVLLAAGAAFPKYGSGGLGIYLGNNRTLAKMVTPRTDNFYLYENIPDKSSSYNVECTAKVSDKTAKEMDKYTLFEEDLSEYSFEKLNLKEATSVNKRLCQNGLCCNFDIETETAKVNKEKSMKQHEYFLVIRNGLRTYGNKTYQNSLETCGLIACTGASIKQCGKRFADYDQISWPVIFKKLRISAEFKNSVDNVQFPNSLLADFSPLPPSCTTWTCNKRKSIVERAFSINTPISKLLTFAIFGRNYAMDIK